MSTFKKVYLVLLPLVLLALLAGGVGCAVNRTQLSSPTVVLLTDFGTVGYRVPQLKGNIFSKYPDAKVVDITHELPAFDVPTGAYELSVAANEFPSGFVFVAVVAPGDSTTTQRFLVATSNKDQVFVVPDNGLITYIARETGLRSVYQVSQQLLTGKMEDLSVTKVLGQAGGLVAAGIKPEQFGPAVTDAKMLDIQPARIQGNKLTGAIVFVDNFGNSPTNISREMAQSFGLKKGDTVVISAGGKSVTAGFGNIYSDVPKGDPIVFVNSLQVVELSINMGNFAGTHGLKAGAGIEITRK